MDKKGEVARAARRPRGHLVRTLTERNLLTDPHWRAAFGEVARHPFVPRYFLPSPDDRWAAVDATDQGWLQEVYSDQVLVTQLDGDPTRWAHAREHGPVAGTPTCSSSMPTIMAVMLHALQLRGDERVLEVGTGTGYNAALLCHRLGDDRVSTVDVDADLVADAREHLSASGYQPVCETADGTLGLPDGAPYDRVLCTCAVSTVPLPWLAQTRSGGLIVTTLHRPIGAGLVRITVGSGEYGEGRVLPDDGRFMPLRAHRQTGAARLADRTAGEIGELRATGLPVSAVIDPSSRFEFFAGLALPRVVPVRRDGDTLLVHPDGSWARHVTRHHEHTVSQGGPHRLWDIAERAYTRWLALGEPGRARFGITVRPHRQELWLDDADSRHRWPLR
ncbi:methyltransferase of ATP-grasp peptide maturase system [Herbihabitans rhizosphaerae]|uniref:Protein-L-isoaspartate O-methyltransferase n=1 Tax=Herbihabitans rhizosphaerae TaxID=1872711 RepID=A0A4Q7L5V9_9PSEU|nr:ATP-grasp peptide maturase system methyltransferase [Herbihabitans rhizosphaerae]RZS44636.1 methyltransferase of ATP-grasp peptide maturase system [Herbihabitans rhizosphaerae]